MLLVRSKAAKCQEEEEVAEEGGVRIAAAEEAAEKEQLAIHDAGKAKVERKRYRRSEGN